MKERIFFISFWAVILVLTSFILKLLFAVVGVTLGLTLLFSIGAIVALIAKKACQDITID